jgi:hydrogenase maturation protein HypF
MAVREVTGGIPRHERGVVTKRLRCYGIVQGVGMRPTIARHAARAGVAGTVCNKGPYVEIFAQGTPRQLDDFCHLVRTQPPRRADVIKVEVADVPAAEAGAYDGFAIKESEHTRGAIFVSPDIAICDDCKRELFDPTNRRYLHPFINCTCCGPRLTILRSLPYDRERTSMGKFPMCPECSNEYHDPASRRYDAQPVCCNDCGPSVYLLGRPERGRDAITAARRCIAGGGIVAVKGIGGFHLCCDATNEAAVALLRERKRRPQKPFAVMMANEEVARRECQLDPARQEVLTGHQKPIVLMSRRTGSCLAPSVAPGNPRVGVMLPYAPIQLLLFRYDDGVTMPDCLVMTSGNVSGAPICRDDESAASELAGLADLVLSNDRPILTRADDSVMDFFQGQPYMIRRSRGYAPLPVVVSGLGEELPVLAVGGELKNCFCVGKGELMYPSAYVGDLSDLRSVRALEESVERMECLLEAAPAVVAADLHPRYNSRAVAEKIAREAGLPLVEVQHHYAHVVSCMAENDHPGRVLGVSFDGTGYGTDGTVWGGELMVCDYHGFRRVGHVVPFTQVGGDRASREGWRVATVLVHGLQGSLGDTLDVVAALGLTDERTARAQVMMAERKLNAVTSTSAGRLFDAASAILGIRRESTFEGEASCALQYAAEAHAEAGGAGAALPPRAVEPRRGPDGQLELPTDELFGWLVDRRLAGEDAAALAYAFHDAMARQVAAACAVACGECGLDTVALSGGCFQNTLLLGLTKRYLEEGGLVVLTHGLVPPNDGGIALGQAVVAAQRVLDGRVPGAGKGAGEAPEGVGNRTDG